MTRNDPLFEHPELAAWGPWFGPLLDAAEEELRESDPELFEEAAE